MGDTYEILKFRAKKSVDQLALNMFINDSLTKCLNYKDHEFYNCWNKRLKGFKLAQSEIKKILNEEEWSANKFEVTEKHWKIMPNKIQV
jgi:hypothetical protein